MKILTGDEMRRIEDTMVQRGTPLDALMRRAGTAVGKRAQSLARGELTLILTGPGNNGGDGLVAATYLAEAGDPAVVYTFRRTDTMDFDGLVIAAEEDTDQARLTHLMRSSRVVVDALLGIGQTRPPEGTLATILRCADENVRAGTTRLAVDIPTGVDTDTGAVAGVAFRADHTLCMSFLKRGVVLHPGAEYAGFVEVVDIGIPPDLAGAVAVSQPSDADVARLLPQRRPDSNKGTYGRLVIIGGSRNFLGAPALAALAAYRIGAGLVELAVTPYVQQSVAAHLLEPVFSPLPEDDGKISTDALPLIAHLLERASACVFGPGMGLSDGTILLTRQVLDAMASSGIRGAVVDADALNALARVPDWWHVDVPLVLTPHPGEMARRTGEEIKTIQSDRIGTARRYAEKWNKTVVLNGTRTVVAAPSGEIVLNPTGGPNLATAGTGDVLSGAIGGLLAQGCTPFDAAVVGAYLHGRAGDIRRSEYGDAGTVAGDVAMSLPAARLSVLQAEEAS